MTRVVNPSVSFVALRSHLRLKIWEGAEWREGDPFHLTSASVPLFREVALSVVAPSAQ